MKRLIAVLPAVLLLLLLSACQTASPQQISDAARALQTACTIRDAASAAFDAYVAAKPDRIDAKGIAWKKGVMATTQPICSNPAAAADPAKALDTVIQVGFALSDYISQIERGPRP